MSIRQLALASTLFINTGAALMTVWLIAAYLHSAQNIQVAYFLLLMPYAAGALLGWLAHRDLLSSCITLLGTLAMSVAGFSALYRAFVLYPDPQNGLLVLFMPVYQGLFLGGTVGLVLLLLFVRWVIGVERNLKSPPMATA